MNTSSSTESPAFPYNLFLIGFMGTGKSTVASELSRLLKRTVLEMDETIEQREAMSIPDIFSAHGESYFRELEARLLTETQNTCNLIVSCGGGAAMRKSNVTEMKKSGVIILLTAAPETILERVQSDDNRPLLKGRKTAADIAALMDTRKNAYANAADIIIATDGKTAAEIAEEILSVLPKEGAAHGI